MKNILIYDLYTNNNLNVSFYETGNHIGRHSYSHIIDAECTDDTLIQLDKMQECSRKTMVVDIGLSTASASMLTRLPAMLPMSGAIGTIRWINLVLSTSTSTIPRPTPTPTMVRGWSLLKPVRQDNRDLRLLLSITAKSGSFIDTYSFEGNKNSMRQYHKRFLHRSSLAKIMAKHYPPQGGLVG